MEKKKAINILGLGLNTRFRAMLQVFLKRQYGTRYKLADQDEDVLVADLDNLSVRDSLAKYRNRYPSRPMILCSIDNIDCQARDNTFVLRKPFTLAELASTFDAIDKKFHAGQQKLESGREEKQHVNVVKKKKVSHRQKEHGFVARHTAASVISKKDNHIVLNALNSIPEDGKVAEYAPESYLQGVLISAYQQAREENKNILITDGDGSIKVDTKRNKVQMGMGTFQLLTLASLPITSKDFISLLPRHQLKIDLSKSEKIISFEALIWQISLYASRGRVPVGTKLKRPIQFKSWPNLTRLKRTPNALRMAALWTAQPCSIVQVRKMLNIPNSDVLNFYSAASAANLARKSSLVRDTAESTARDTAENTARDMAENAVRNMPERNTGLKSLFGSILRKLHA